MLLRKREGVVVGPIAGTGSGPGSRKGARLCLGRSLHERICRRLQLHRDRHARCGDASFRGHLRGVGSAPFPPAALLRRRCHARTKGPGRRIRRVGVEPVQRGIEDRVILARFGEHRTAVDQCRCLTEDLAEGRQRGRAAGDHAPVVVGHGAGRYEWRSEVAVWGSARHQFRRVLEMNSVGYPHCKDILCIRLSKRFDAINYRSDF
mmetsp:Transcript_14371/g.28712  ORF Transcript_14371/g.28712 Transcript_14371/m.28712 type:complete len:206 (-) Transcript_14371:19-636(-)